MIKSLRVNGFKSLNNFKIDFTNGLNVLIGPNGAGKSNICQALGMIAAAAEDSLSDYIISLGGTSAIFPINSKNTKSKKMSFFCNGEINEQIVNISNISSSEYGVQIRYEYTINILLNDKLTIDKELLKIYQLSSSKEYKPLIQANRIYDEIHFIIEDKENAGLFMNYLEDQKTNHIQLFQLLKDPMISFLPILSNVFNVLAFQLICSDLSFLRAWQINPKMAIIPSDILEPSDLLPDGKRLSNAIYSLIKSKDDLFDDISSLLSIILPNYQIISPEITLDGSTRSFSITDTRGVKYPAGCISDGTIKTLALLVGVLSQKKNTSIIEEPENYLHPWAAISLIEYFRDHFKDGVCILTTHSETILNSIKPEEIYVVENIDGNTKITRPGKKNRLAKAISESGFGCGYHYTAGSLGGVPL